MTEKGKVLFVDDEKRVLNSMRGMFRRDYELFLTTEGAEAVSAARSNDVDVIVADQRMPGMSGVEVLEQVRRVSPRTVRILLTGYADPDAIQGSINVGEVFRFLSKPCPPALLKETLELAIAAARAQPADAQVMPNDAWIEAGSTKSALDGVAAASRTAVDDPTPTSGTPPMIESSVSATREIPEATRPDQGLSSQAPRQPINVDSAAAPAPVADAPAAAPVDADTPQSVDAASQAASHAAAQPAAPADTLTESRRIRLNASSVGVVVFSANRMFVSTVRSAVAKERELIVASSLKEVAQSLSERRAGVFLTDATSDINMLQRIIGALKQYLPELVAIVVSDSRDANDMISLINYGQVYRFNVKPVEPLPLRTDINAAVLKHLQLLNHPELIQRHQVVEIRQPEETATSPTLNRFLGTVTRLRGLWSGIGQKSH